MTTKTAQFTQGPWVVDETVSEDNAGQPTLGIYADGTSAFGYVAGIHCGPDVEITDEDRANAALIAAAPAMYEALQATLAYFMRSNQSHAPEVRVIRAALAQAEGKHD